MPMSRKLNLVDLAGSESVRRTQATGQRFSEGVNINKGLLALGNCIRALTDKKTHVPYRDSALTKVLKECLQHTSHICMIACISPTETDRQETINTLRFANKAKDLMTKPMPTFLSDSFGALSSKKRKFPEMSAQTPGVTWNKTIHTPTPSKIARSAGSARRLNLTIATPGKRGKFEFATPMSLPKTSTMTSTLMKKSMKPSMTDPLTPNVSGVSLIEVEDKAADETDSNDCAKTSDRQDVGTFNIQDISSILSPYMKKMTSSILTGLSQELHKERALISANSLKGREKMPKSKAVPRMTSSPLNSGSITITECQDISEDESLEHCPALLVTNQESCANETLISGTGITLPLQDLTNRRLQGSPNLRTREISPPSRSHDSPASTATERTNSASPTIEEMERCLGLAPESPSLYFVPQVEASRHSKKKTRSSRRTTMMGSELETTLQFIRESNTIDRRRSGRPLRAAAHGVFYGSPDKENRNESRRKVSALLNFIHNDQ